MNFQVSGEVIATSPHSAILQKGTQDKSPKIIDKRSSSYSRKIYLAPGFKSRLRNLPVKPLTLLRFLIGKWKYSYLDWGEREILERLCLLNKKIPGAESLLVLLNSVRFKPILDRFLEDPALRTFKLQGHLFGAFYHHLSRVRVPTKRNWKGLRVSWVHLEYLLTDNPQQVVNKPRKRERKRGHTDHGALPDNPLARKADEEGGQLLSEKQWEEQGDRPKWPFPNFSLDVRKWFQRWPAGWF